MCRTRLRTRWYSIGSLLWVFASAANVGAQKAPDKAPAESSPLDDLAEPEGGGESRGQEGESSSAPSESGGEDQSGAGANVSPEAAAAAAPQSNAEAAEAPPAEGAATAAPAAAPAAAAPGSDEIVVTGSRLQHTKHALPAAVDVVDRKKLEQSGANNIAELTRTMDINRGSEFNTAVSTAAVGTTQFNLRGLGLSSTLVLLNGRRLVMSGAASVDGSNFVDVNTIPLPLIDRVEILKGGASALYGSDAVAGVVNMITRKHVNGFEAQVGGQATDKFDQHEWDVSLLGGTESEHTRIVGAMTYFKREPLYASDRSYTDNGKNTSVLGYPSAYVRLMPTGVPYPSTLVNPATNMVDPTRYSTFVDPACQTPQGPGSNRLPFPPNAKVEAYCTFDFNNYYMLLAPEQRLNMYTTIEHDLGDHAMVFAEAGYARNRASRETSPAYPILSTLTVPADNMNNNQGALLSWVGRAAGGASPGYQTTFASDTIHSAAGFKGDFGGLVDGGDDWEWELSGTYGTNRYAVNSQDVLKGALQTALNSCKPTDDPANCYNPFSLLNGGQPNSQAIKNRITGETTGVTDVELTTLGVDFNGPLFRLPGGDLGLAVGGQVRREVAQYNADHDYNQENYIFLIGAPDWSAQRKIFAGYGELVMPFFQGFEVQGAARLEDYSDAGSAVSPMAGLSWTPATTFAGDQASPASKVTVRSTYAQAFRAPSLLQEYGTIVELAQLSPTGYMNGTLYNPAPAFGAVRTVGSTSLKPQTSNAITAGLEWHPVKGLGMTVDYWWFDYEDIIIKERGQNILSNNAGCNTVASNPMNASMVPPGVSTACDSRVHFNPTTGAVSSVDASFVNATSIQTQGLDLGVNYASNFGATAGTFSAGVSGSYVIDYIIPDDQLGPQLRASKDVSCSGHKCDVAGLRNFTTFARPIPRLRATLPLGWNLDAHSAALIVHYIGSYKDDENPTGPTNILPTINPWVSFDLQYAYKLMEGKGYATTFRVGVLNLLDAAPPKVNTGLGYDVLTHDPRGRMIYARLIQEM